MKRRFAQAVGGIDRRSVFREQPGRVLVAGLAGQMERRQPLGIAAFDRTTVPE